MKRNQLYIVVLFVLLCAGCDVIEESNYQINYEPPVVQEEEVARNILLEDYTGIRCTNCPEATAKINNLKSTFEDRLISVSIHAGYFARPIGNYDLRCEAGNEYATFLNVKSYPSGIINRAVFGEEMVLTVAKWDAAITQVPMKAAIAIKKPVIVYNEEDRSFSVLLDVKNLEESSMKYSLLLWLVEDNIVTPQETKEGRVDNYLQRHVLRGALNGTWGEDIALDPSKEYISITKGPYTLKENYKAEDCSIVVLLCDKDTKEVLQVVEGLFLP